MTTDDTFVDTESSPSVIEYNRDISTLLSLDTYQGMTDTEIDAVIDYKCDLAYNRGRADSVNELIVANSRDMKAHYASVSEKRDALMQKMISTLVPFVSVTGEEVD